MYPTSLSSHTMVTPHKGEEAIEDYELDRVIEKVERARADGLKTAVFVGRRNSQSIPQEEGWVWFTLDSKLKNKYDCETHLQVDFDNPESMAKIHHLFNKVVVDLEVIKYSDTPWDTFQPLLAQEPDSTFISEATAMLGSSYSELPEYHPKKGTLTTPIFEETHLKKNAIEKWKKTVGEAKAEEEYKLYVSVNPDLVEELGEECEDEEELEEVLRQEFQDYILERENIKIEKPNHLPELYRQIQEYLGSFYEIVELKEGLFPYLSARRNHWVCHSPKVVT